MCGPGIAFNSPCYWGSRRVQGCGHEVQGDVIQVLGSPGTGPLDLDDLELTGNPVLWSVGVHVTNSFSNHYLT